MSQQSARAIAVGDKLVHKTFPPITRHRLALYCGASGDDGLGERAVDVGDGVQDALAEVGVAAITQLGAKLTCEGAVTDVFEAGGEKRVKIALTTKDETGEVKLAGEAIIAI